MSVNALMNPILPATAAQVPAESRVVKNSGEDSNFYEYMERKVGGERQQEKNILGAAAQRKQAAAQGADNGTASGKEMEDPSVAQLLGQFMLELQKVSEDIEAGPGDWSLSLSDQELLQQLAAKAGMSEEKLSQILQQMENQEGKLNLNELLASLARHFEELQGGEAITVPETDLPLLESFLDRMGLSPQDIENISNEAVRGDNKLDLVKFLQGLEELDSDQSISLTDWEAEQLQDILAKAGVSERMQRELLPERIPSWLNPSAENKLVQLTLSRLKDMLAKGMQEVEGNQLKADLPGFLKDLEGLLAKTEFDEKSVGWSPAVQKTVNAIYDKLLESVDMSKVHVEAGNKSGQTLSEQDLEADLGDMFEEHAEAGPEAGNESELLADSDLGGGQGQDVPEQAELIAPGSDHLQPDDEATVHSTNNVFAQNVEAVGSEAQAANDTEAPKPPPRMPQQVQQQTFETLTQGVIRGLKNNEHHLVLKLYPKELGEVKVEMMVRDEQVAVSFSMENAKVKDIMEGNMDQFRDNLEKQGFVLEECMVSVGQDDADDAWRQFEFTWKNQQDGTDVKRESLADLPENVLYHRPQTNNGSEKGIDLFA